MVYKAPSQTISVTHPVLRKLVGSVSSIVLFFKQNDISEKMFG